ncbi:cyanidin 3-O-rutinoside 5-O-glucosyltransferase-like [Curcuma longa]|uniref:cyanidin 3-O-rutinoside 5-O-glucosyltransferase-like n=1 Tax=Curcuma longa TaxID=136217 RepID=UPI003D9EC7A2
MEHHFLVVADGHQGQVSPALNLSRRLADAAGARITFSTTVAGHRRMFPASADQEVHEGLISFIPFSDGQEDSQRIQDLKDFFARTKSVGSQSLSAILRSLDARGQPVTCVIYGLLLSWAADVARNHGLPSVYYWIQPATVFALYYNYFQDCDRFMSSHDDPQVPVTFPGLPPLRIRDLPTTLTITDMEHPMILIQKLLKEDLDVLDREASTAIVLANTFEELEADALTVRGRDLKVMAIGPVMSVNGPNLFELDEQRYMEWLDSKAGGSVVYVSFGSFTTLKKRQAEEIARGLRATGRPYLWVVRKDNGEEVKGLVREETAAEEKAMVVEWCTQVRVLSHAAVGCFVTHCGWNSTSESLACGVPMVGVPQFAEQPTNAKLLEVWGTGVRAETDAEGVVEAAELARCVESVMGEGEKAAEIRRSAEMWKDLAKAAVAEGGSSDRNLRAFVEEMASSSTHLISK